MQHTTWFETLVVEGEFEPERFTRLLHTTRAELARSVGLGRDALTRRERISSPKVQMRMRQMVEILIRLCARFEEPLVAYAWYRSSPLPGFGGRTCMDLVAEGRAPEVLEYFNAVDAGVHA